MNTIELPTITGKLWAVRSSSTAGVQAQPRWEQLEELPQVFASTV